VSAIRGAGDAQQAQHAALAAHERAHDTIAEAVGTAVGTAATTGGMHLATAAQAAGADVSDYDPDDGDPDSPAAWAADNQDDIAAGVQHHTGRMLTAALVAAALGTAPIAAMALAANDLYDQWTGQTDNGDYARQIAGDLVVLGWGMGEQWSIGQITASGEWVGEKTWNTVGDDHVRAAHEDLDGVTVDASDAFSADGEDLDYPCDPAGSADMTAGCRCWLTWTLTNTVTGEMIDIGEDDEE